MTQCRRITPDDVPEVTRFALATLKQVSANDPVYVSAEKVRNWVSFFARTERPHFQRATFDGDRCVAALAVYVNEMPFHERCEGHVFIAYATSPGAGAPLFKAMRAWFDDSMLVRRIVWPMNEVFDARMRDLAGRYGFKSEAPMFIQWK